MQIGLTAYMPQNTFLTLAIVIVAYMWYRTDFVWPRMLRSVTPAPRSLLRITGWTVIAIIVMHSIGDLIGGRTQIADSAPHYARRELQPWLFWRQLAWQLGLGVFLGASCIRLGRARLSTYYRRAPRKNASNQ